MASVLGGDVVKVPIGDLVPYPDNPRKGNVDMIAESLKENGQFRPLIVQKSTSYILGGNHTFLGAKKLKWKKVDVVFVDVDEQHARKIVLADNRTSDLATYDTEVLMKLINDLEEPAVGTGYTGADIQNLVSAMAERDSDLVNEVISDKPRITFEGDELTFEERLDRKDEAVKAMASKFTDDAEELQRFRDGHLTGELDEKERFHAELQARIERLISDDLPSSNYWGVPDLRDDMLVEKFPDNLMTWGGQDASKDDGKSPFLLSWGSVSATGVPWNRTMLCFYSEDYKWQNWYTNTAFYIAKVMNEGVRESIAPDNSTAWDGARFYNLEAVFQCQWLARLMQECGIRIAPNLILSDAESAKLSVLGIPKGTPTLATSMQALTEKDMDLMGITGLLRTVVNEISPEQFMVYGGPPARRMCEKLKLNKGIEIIWQPNMSHIRNTYLKESGFHEKRKAHEREVKAARGRLEGAGEAEEPEEAPDAPEEPKAAKKRAPRRRTKKAEEPQSEE